MTVLCKAMNISLDKVMGFGDDSNDMMSDYLKAKEITETNDNDGVAFILERLSADVLNREAPVP
ncbi:hypothetical protein M6D81_30580 [Paenibacillus sp. J5C_2022]|uniref:HAD family hydrolase n=1 Tax=Paenibacillus sp. J5C2022 TaxID=2977129 RepID=UPI0021D15EC1|nr:hypothetical protein [Paenibacillus sp. J5C2022]MCU6713054.1 hypothetical protein [Paenibacillus sp. J5C2022]